MKNAVTHFPIDGEPTEYRQISTGHINRTFFVTTDNGSKYVLQSVNSYVFPNVDAVMDNIAMIGEYLKARPELEVPIISYIDTTEGRHWYDDGGGGCWRCYRFAEDSVCFSKADNTDMLSEAARAFGRFMEALSGFDASMLTETIKDFHNTPERYRQLEEAIKNNTAGRLENVMSETEFALSRKEKACRLHKMREEGILPLRVTHNDTKISNVLFNRYTGEAICVIDLDTVMPGLSAYDYGDAIRAGACACKEDEKEESKAYLDLELFRAFTKGYIEACPSLSEAETEALPLGAYAMTAECGIRFLADYLNGDRYFSISYPEHNLDRARTQFSLLRDMEKHWDDMQRITSEYR